MSTTKKPSSLDRLRDAARSEALARGEGAKTEASIVDEPNTRQSTPAPPPITSIEEQLAAKLKAVKRKPARTEVRLNILPQRRIWKSQDGRETRFCDLDDKHLVHILFLLKRHAVRSYLAHMDAKRQIAKRDIFAMGYGMGVKAPVFVDGNPYPEIATHIFRARSGRFEHTSSDFSELERRVASSSFADPTEGTTWEDYTDVAFHCVRLEVLRRGNLDDAIALLQTDCLRLKD